MHLEEMVELLTRISAILQSCGQLGTVPLCSYSRNNVERISHHVASLTTMWSGCGACGRWGGGGGGGMMVESCS
jgi:hypothetical protein